MFKKTIALMGALLCTVMIAAAQYNIQMMIADTTIIASVTTQGKPVFTISGMNTLVNQYTVTGFQKAYPSSRFLDTRKIYRMTVSSMNLPAALVSSYPAYFLQYEDVVEGQILAYTPNDYVTTWPTRYTGYLDYINATDAWGVTKGDPNVVVGVTDLHLHTSHPDLAGKIAQVNYNGSYHEHGTMITGLIAAATDNGLYYPSIGFNCRIDFIGRLFTGDMLVQSERGRKVLNGSWGDHAPSTIINFSADEQRMYQEIYENGALACHAAGNGHGRAWDYSHPSSYDYVFSTTGIRYDGAEAGWHDDGTDTFNTQQHNPRVDIAAPGLQLGGLTYDPNDPDTTWKYKTWGECWGSSCASPLTAGTAALMLSANPCYSPYQLEYILKKSANALIYSIPENIKYIGRLGAGGLDAGKTLENVRDGVNGSNPEFSCNNPSTATFFIEGIDINTVCAPGYSSNSVVPTLTPILRNGTPGYTYRWEYLSGNNVTLSALNVAAPTITASTGDHKAVLRLTVYDNSTVQKVASRRFTIQLTTANTYDLAGRDSYMDMLDEPNSMTVLDKRETQYYMSPDLWNRQLNDGQPEHENAEYFSSASNYAHVKVRNVGCSTFVAGSPNHYLKLYWTVASTGENWDHDWNGNTQLAASAGGVIPAGGEITTGNGIYIGTLQPGQSTTIVQPWNPVNPQDFAGSPTDLNVCLLARIWGTGSAYDGMAFPEEFNKEIIHNVRPNNNIFTRNLWVKDLHAGNKTGKTRVVISNARDIEQAFDVQFINDREINLHFGGNFSEIGYVKLYLGDLYTLWMDSGGEGSYLERNDDEQWVTMDGSQTLELLNLVLPENAKYPVDVEFTLYDGVTIPNYRYDFHLRQFALDGDGEKLPDVYGSMSFQIKTRADLPERKAGEESAETINTKRFSIYPNPAKNLLAVSYIGEKEEVVTIDVYDVMGRKLISKKEQHLFNSYIALDVSTFVTGVYFVNITNNNGVSERFKFVKE